MSTRDDSLISTSHASSSVGHPPPPSPTKGKRKRQSLGVATNGPVRCEDRNDIVASPGTKKMRYDDLAHREDEARGPTKNQGQADIFADNVESVDTRVEKPSVLVVDGPLQGSRGQDEAVSAASVTAEDMANATPTLMLEAVPAAETASQVAYTTSPAPADNTMPQAIGDGNQHIVYNGYILKIICPVDRCNYILDESNERTIGDHFYGKHGYKQNEKLHYGPCSSNLTYKMSTRALNDDEVLTELNKMVSNVCHCPK